MTLKIADALRVGAKFCFPHKCICGVNVDPHGYHGLSCPKNTGRFSRHFQLNDVIQRALVSAGFPSIREPVGISRTDGKRPDGLTLLPWSRGKSLLWDATCADTMALSHLSQTSKVAGSAAIVYNFYKHKKYQDLTDKYIFVAFAVETFGPWCSEAKQLASDIGKHLRGLTGDPRSTLFLKISIAIQRGNAIGVMGTFPHNKALEGIFYF
ncbi:hypothetical protein C0J52_19664 [Blattella germanica]|nr:hypothetical protein C0J52_19664 [Blattella germanica]